MRKGDWLQVYSGIQFWPLDPRPDEINIVDIAHALSLQCRYAGHVVRFYSVAEHCLHVSRAVSPEFALEGLLHDAGEAYLVDLPRPVKNEMPDYKVAEKRLDLVIAEKFGLHYWGAWPDEVRDIDNRILLDERKQLMSVPPMPWGQDGLEPVGIKVVSMSPRKAEAAFLARFMELMR